MRRPIVGLALAGLVTLAAAPGRAGEITTAVGSGAKGYSGDGGPATAAQLDNPFDVIFDRDGHLYLSDTFNHVVRRVDAKTGRISTVVGRGEKGFSGDGGPADKAAMNEPYGLAFDPSGRLYVADRLNRRVRRFDPKDGTISTFAGDGSKVFSGDGGPADRAGLVEPNGLAVDPDGRRLLIADVGDNRVRAVNLATGTISTFAGDGKNRHEGDGGPATAASIAGARAVKLGPGGRVYVLERQGNTLRAVEPGTGVITTVAGTGKKGYSGDGGPATAATFNGPKELAVDPAGNVFIVDTENHAIRRIDARTGVVTTVAGDGKAGPQGDGGDARSARLARPHGVVVGPDGMIFIGDTENHRIRRVRP